MKVKRKIELNQVDLDHILDIEILDENKTNPPSELFIEGLLRELELNGIDLDEGEIELSITLKI